jgi:hypothetical protein
MRAFLLCSIPNVTFLILLTYFSSCGAAVANFDPKFFETDKTSVVLGVDLRDEFNIRFGFIVRDEDTHPPELRHTVLPFPTSKSEGNEQLLATWASYQDTTYLTYILPGIPGNYYSIELVPSILKTKDLKEVDRLSSSVSLITDGQTRTFIYRYPRHDGESIVQKVLSTNNTDIDRVAVLLPNGARPLEVRGGRTSDPPELFSKDKVGFYPAMEQDGINHLEINYWVPATEDQLALIALIGKVFAAILTPMVTIGLTKAITATQVARRRQIIIAGTIIQVIALGLLVFFSYRWEGELSISDLSEPILGLFVGVAAVLVWWVG